MGGGPFSDASFLSGQVSGLHEAGVSLAGSRAPCASHGDKPESWPLVSELPAQVLAPLCRVTGGESPSWAPITTLESFSVLLLARVCHTAGPPRLLLRAGWGPELVWGLRPPSLTGVPGLCPHLLPPCPSSLAPPPCFLCAQVAGTLVPTSNIYMEILQSKTPKNNLFGL